MNYAETLAYLFSALPMFTRDGASAIKPGLNNIIALCNHLGNPQLHFPCVHVAGTNGKGSSSHSIASILQCAGYKVGLYTSPHLKNFTERIRINGQELSSEQVVDFVAKNKAIIEVIQPSFFEITVAMAFQAFFDAKVDVAVIEVGMGGRLDSTNIITPLVCLITSISYDHKMFLGNTLPEIAGEKAGIIKEGVPVVISSKQPEIAHVFNIKSKELKATITYAYQYWDVKLLHKDFYQTTYGITSSRNGGKFIAAFELPGPYQLDNLPGILETIYQLQKLGWSINNEAILAGLAQVKSLTGLKGRWHVLGTKPLMLADTAHNPSGIEWVFNEIKTIEKQHLYLVFGVMKDKDLEEIIAFLPIQDATYICCAPDMPRAKSSAELTQYLVDNGRKAIDASQVPQALEMAKSLASPDDMIYIGGSTFVVAEIPEL